MEPIVLHGRLTFANDRDGNIDLWAMDLPGGQPRRLTTDPAADFSPTWSPDGKSIAFRSDRRGNDEVFVMNADGTGQRNLTRNPASDYSPAWSPDGRTIAFATDREDHTGNDVWLMDANGGNPRPLVEQTGIDEYPAWSPDGSQVAFACTLGTILPSSVGDFEVCVVNADGTGLRRITDAPGISHAAGWTPEGSEVVFASNRDQNPGDVSPCGDVYAIRPDGSGLRRITGGSRLYCPASVTGDGHIIFSADWRDPGGESDLWVMDADGSDPTLVAAIQGNEQDGTLFP
jgi:Tol biopolymer transport system component